MRRLLQWFVDLSLRYKIPLRVGALVMITAALVTASLIVLETETLRGDLLHNSGSLGRVLAKTLVVPLTHDDVWRAYEIVSTPFHAEDDPATSAELVLVLDAGGRVYVSTQPKQFPMLADPALIDRGYAGILGEIAQYSGAEPKAIERSNSGRIHVVTPITADGVRLGTLVMVYSKAAFLPRYVRIAGRAALVTLLVVAVLLPISWWWGQRLAQPLVQLAEGMGKVGPSIPDDSEIRLPESRDELGQAAAAFRRMLAELRGKEQLEREVVVTERLAAVGRLSAGIAHEINNPLGGMLNAVSTFKKHGGDEVFTTKTLLLLERGLQQIKDTVSALLVEARFEPHPLTRDDIEDVRTLVLPNAQRKHARLEWKNELWDAVALPSTLVRQILINLMLNAVNAIEERGNVAAGVYAEDGLLVLRVENDGRHISEERMPYLFEPFASHEEGGHGLGLWVTYQIVRQLRGEIAVESAPGGTRFNVRLPCEVEA